MRKSQVIQLVLVSAALVACHKDREKEREDEYYGRGSNVRTTTNVYHHGGFWYARPYTSSHTYHVIHTSSPSRSSSYSSGSHSYSSSSRGGFGSSAHFSSGS